MLLGHLVSLIHLVPGGWLRVRSVQLALRSCWAFKNEFILVEWDTSQNDLRWWYDEGRLEEGVSLESHSPELMFWSDASDQGWGANIEDQVASGLWSEEEKILSINVRKLLAVERGLLSFLSLLQSCLVAVFLRQHDGNELPSSSRGHSVSSVELDRSTNSSLGRSGKVLLFSQFVMGKNNIVTDSLSWPDQIIGSERTLHQEVFDSLRKRWPMMVDLFATLLNHRLPMYFAPMSDPMAAPRNGFPTF